MMFKDKEFARKFISKDISGIKNSLEKVSSKDINLAVNVTIKDNDIILFKLLLPFADVSESVSLSIAASEGKADFFNLLLPYSKLDEEDYKHLMRRAVLGKNTEIIGTLFECLIDNESKEEAFIHSCIIGDIDVLDFLLTRINIQKIGADAISVAARFNKKEVISTLIPHLKQCDFDIAIYRCALLNNIDMINEWFNLVDKKNVKKMINQAKSKTYGMKYFNLLYKNLKTKKHLEQSIDTTYKTSRSKNKI